MPVLDLFLYHFAVTTHDHAVRYTADEFIGANSIVGFFPAHQYPSTPWHDHDFYELGIVESGSGLHVSDEATELIGRGTVVFVPPGVGHEYRSCQDVRVYNCFFRAELDELELIWAFRDSHLRALFNPTGVYRSRSLRSRVIVSLDDAEMAAVIAALEAIRTADPASRTRARELAHLLIGLDLIANACRTGERLADVRPITPVVVTAAIDALERDIAFPWTLEALSTRLFVGPFHLSRTFAKWVGMPPIRYLAHRRAERAAALLAGTDESVASIGASIGWSDPSHFSRRFHAAFGVSPRAYRRRHREDAPATAPQPRPRSDEA